MHFVLECKLVFRMRTIDRRHFRIVAQAHPVEVFLQVASATELLELEVVG